MKTLILIFVLLLTTCLYSTIINVPAEQPTIQAGINVSVNGDTVLVQPGTYFENINYNGKNITVASLFLTTQDTTYISQTIIDGNQDGSVVTFVSGEDSIAILIGFTIRNGLSGADGGGIYCESSDPSILNCNIIWNSAVDGGGISCQYGASPTISDCFFDSNSAELDGGGIYCEEECNPIITNCTINENWADDEGGGIYCEINCSPSLENITITDNSAPYEHGGGIYCEQSNLSLVNVTITGNFANNGGGICCVEDSSPSFTNVLIMNNSASDAGGGLFLYETSPILENVKIIGNTAYYGGGVSLSSDEDRDTSPSLVNFTITGNSAFYGGGVFCVHYADLNLENVTLTGNSADENGGGIACANGSSVTITDCILWNDSPQEIYFYGSLDPNVTTISYSDIQGGEAGIVTNNNGTVYWLEGNIDEDPLFVGTGDHPFMLQDLSPCVNVGIPDTTGLNLPEYDLAGNPRVYGGRIDMGAYENQNVIVSTNEDLIPLITKLNQNYPNPFNPTTTINYSLKENSKVSLNIYNIKGQKVKQLVSDQLSSGQHSVIWNGTDNNGKSASSGIYFYKLKAGNFEKTRKMILIK